MNRFQNSTNPRNDGSPRCRAIAVLFEAGTVVNQSVDEVDLFCAVQLM